MGKRDVTDWTQKGNQTIKMSGGDDAVDKFRDLAGKAGLLMCAGAVIAVLAKAVKNGGLEEYQEDVPGSAKTDGAEADGTEPDRAETESATTESDKTA